MPILPLMFLIMFALKLLGVLTVSWWVVTAPLWGGLLLWVFVIFFAAWFTMGDR